MSEEKYTIYGLVGRQGVIGYIGHTFGKVISRYHGHATESRFGGKENRKTKWWRSETASGHTPTYVVLEQGEAGMTDAIERETWWIAFGLRQGWPLQNIRQMPDVNLDEFIEYIKITGLLDESTVSGYEKTLLELETNWQEFQEEDETWPRIEEKFANIPREFWFDVFVEATLGNDEIVQDCGFVVPPHYHKYWTVPIEQRDGVEQFYARPLHDNIIDL